MTTLDDQVLKECNVPPEEFMANYIIPGGSEIVDHRLRQFGWDGVTPTAALGLHVEEGKITGYQIFLMGSKEIGRMLASTLWGENLDKESYVKIDPVDLALSTVLGGLVSNWILSDKLDWIYKAYNQETAKYKLINKLDEDGLQAKGASKYNLRIYLGLDKGPKLTGKFGVAPIGDVTGIIGSTTPNFPSIQVGRDFVVKLSPPEPEGAGYGLGFIPFLVYQGEVPPNSLPTFKDIKSAVSNHFNNSCKTKLNKKFSTWKSSSVLGFWEKHDPTYIWPTYHDNPMEDDEVGEQNICSI